MNQVSREASELWMCEGDECNSTKFVFVTITDHPARKIRSISDEFSLKCGEVVKSH